MPFLTRAEIDKTYRLVSGASNSHTMTFNGTQVTFTNTPHASSDTNTVARTIGVTYQDPTTKTAQTTELTVILKKTDVSVGVTIVPLVHPTLLKTLQFDVANPSPAEPPPVPDFTFSASWFGWAGSLSESEVQQVLNALNSKVGDTVSKAVSNIVAHFSWIAGLIVGFVLAIGPYLLGWIDNSGKGQGVCIVDTWPGVWWVQTNPVPWGF
jgi:hypothetical protein